MNYNPTILTKTLSEILTNRTQCNVQSKLIDAGIITDDHELLRVVGALVEDSCNCKFKQARLKYIHTFTNSKVTNLYLTLLSVVAGVTKDYAVLDGRRLDKEQVVSLGLPEVSVTKMCITAAKKMDLSLRKTLPPLNTFFELVEECCKGYIIMCENMIAIQSHTNHLRKKFPGVAPEQLEKSISIARPSLLYSSRTLAREKFPLDFLFSFLYFTFPHEGTAPVRMALLDGMVDDKEISRFNDKLNRLTEEELNLYLNVVLLLINNRDAQVTKVAQRCLARMLCTQDMPQTLQNTIKGIHLDIDNIEAARLRARSGIITSVSADIMITAQEAIKRARQKKKKDISDIQMAGDFADFCKQHGFEPSKFNFEFYKKVRDTYA